ncbi:MAG: polysaccharide deacetylase family protein [Phycisphaerae bacterium]|nr:polysaccharide deacetylase family protein [Phycisphaerae bacterium]
MASVCFYFQVHQPYRLRRYSVFDADAIYFDEYKNAEILRKVSNKCYLPANQVMLDLIRQHNGQFRISYSLTGVVMVQFEQYYPKVLDSFKALADTGCVEFLAETYYHSLSFLYSREEFTEQVNLQRSLIKKHFGQEPKVFRDTELIYNNDLAHLVSQLGFKGVICEGADHILLGRSPNFLYHAPRCTDTKLLLKNYRLSDDIAFRFGNRDWKEWPLTSEKFAGWVNQVNGNGYVVNLFMDYETLGEHQWADTGIFDFMRHVPEAILRYGTNDFKTPSQVVDTYPISGELDVPHMVSWADTERDLSAWLGNAMQSNALHELYKLEGQVKSCGDPQIISDWRKLQTSDHFYYMCTKYFADGDVHKYFNPYESPYDSYINFMNVLDNIRYRLRQASRNQSETITSGPGQKTKLSVAKRR